MKVVTKNDVRTPEMLRAQRARFEAGVENAVSDRVLTTDELVDLQREFAKFSTFVDWKMGPLSKKTDGAQLSDAQRAASRDDVVAWLQERHPILAEGVVHGGYISGQVALREDTFGRVDVPISKVTLR